jgi:hypothetical protein
MNAKLCRVSRNELQEFSTEIEKNRSREVCPELAMFAPGFDGVSPSPAELARLPLADKLKLALRASDALRRAQGTKDRQIRVPVL